MKGRRAYVFAVYRIAHLPQARWTDEPDHSGPLRIRN
jgi:hypothetical protein